jgi:scyllo-inositol 2-dehydrogenase (NADP+)
MAELRGAVIGYGLAGAVFHAPLIAATPGLRVSTVVTGNPERQAAASRAYPDAMIAASAEEVFEGAAEDDFVVVAAPNEVHVALARKGLDAGLPVVVDKPFAPSADEARSLVEQAEQLGVPIAPYMNRRWDSDQLTLRRLLEEKRLGEVIRYESRLERWHPALSEARPWSETSPPEAGGGILLDLGTHLVDQAMVLFGEPERVYAELANHRGGGADDDAFLALEHARGFACSATARRMSSPTSTGRRMRLSRARDPATKVTGAPSRGRDGGT